MGETIKISEAPAVTAVTYSDRHEGMSMKDGGDGDFNRACAAFATDRTVT
jgi:hypothetical protein